MCGDLQAPEGDWYGVVIKGIDLEGGLPGFKSPLCYPPAERYRLDGFLWLFLSYSRGNDSPHPSLEGLGKVSQKVVSI